MVQRYRAGFVFVQIDYVFFAGPAEGEVNVLVGLKQIEPIFTFVILERYTGNGGLDGLIGLVGSRPGDLVHLVGQGFLTQGYTLPFQHAFSYEPQVVGYLSERNLGTAHKGSVAVSIGLDISQIIVKVSFSTRHHVIHAIGGSGREGVDVAVEDGMAGVILAREYVKIERLGRSVIVSPDVHELGHVVFYRRRDPVQALV